MIVTLTQPKPMPLKIIFIEEKNLPTLLKLLDPEAEFTSSEGAEMEAVAESFRAQAYGLSETPFIRDIVYASLEKQYKEEHTNRYTETTIPETGWYFWYPKHPMHTNRSAKNVTYQKRPKFILLDDMDDKPGLNCKMYAGTFIGPIEPPSEKPSC